MAFKANAVNGLPADPLVLNFKSNDNILIYPNPVRDIATISLTAERQGKVNIRIVDVTGKILITDEVYAAGNGVSQIKLNCNKLNPGLYFVYLTVDGVTHIRKIEKL
jgi:hypothetical protein